MKRSEMVEEIYSYLLFINSGHKDYTVKNCPATRDIASYILKVVENFDMIKTWEKEEE